MLIRVGENINYVSEPREKEIFPDTILIKTECIDFFNFETIC